MKLTILFLFIIFGTTQTASGSPGNSPPLSPRAAELKGVFKKSHGDQNIFEKISDEVITKLSTLEGIEKIESGEVLGNLNPEIIKSVKNGLDYGTAEAPNKFWNIVIYAGAKRMEIAKTQLELGGSIVINKSDKKFELFGGLINSKKGTFQSSTPIGAQYRNYLNLMADELLDYLVEKGFDINTLSFAKAKSHTLDYTDLSAGENFSTEVAFSYIHAFEKIFIEFVKYYQPTGILEDPESAPHKITLSRFTFTLSPENFSAFKERKYEQIPEITRLAVIPHSLSIDQGPSNNKDRKILFDYIGPIFNDLYDHTKIHNKQELFDIISKFAYFYFQVAPYYRGSATIGEWMILGALNYWKNYSEIFSPEATFSTIQGSGLDLKAVGARSLNSYREMFKTAIPEFADVVVVS